MENKGNITLLPDARLKWSGVIAVMDVCHKAGYSNVRFVARRTTTSRVSEDSLEVQQGR